MSGTGQLTATEQRGAGGTGVATSLGGHVGYVPTVQAGIVVLDLRNHKEIGTIQPGTVGLLGPGAIAISGNGRRLCLLDGGFLQPSGTVQVISLSNR